MKSAAFIVISVLAAAIILSFTACKSDPDITLENISVTALPSKIEYRVGDILNLAGLVVTAAYSDGSKVDVTGYTVSAFDSQQIGLKTITVGYNGKSAEFIVAVVGDINDVKSIAITAGPDKIEYLVGEALDFKGLELTAIYNDGTTAVVLNYTIVNIDTENPGLKTLTVNYGGKSTFSKITFINKGLIRMAEVIAGVRFTMGSNDTPAGTYSEMTGREEPAHQVILSCFYVGIYPVTQAQYRELVGTNPGYFQGANLPAGLNGNKLPVEQVNWYEAVEFCNRLSEAEGLNKAYIIDKTPGSDSNNNAGDENDPFKYLVTLVNDSDGYRLPTEAEWEFACRAGTSAWYSVPAPAGGNTITKTQANFNSGGPAEAGSYTPNALGLYDMHGNVWEWCWDWFDENYYAGSPMALPKGPNSGQYRVGRGGSWSSTSAALLRSSCREYFNQGQANNDTGFRVVRSKYPDGIYP